jgi:hypothetical protein
MIDHKILTDYLQVPFLMIYLFDEINLDKHLVLFEKDPFKALIHRCPNQLLGQIVGTGPYYLCSNCGSLSTTKHQIAAAELLGCIIPATPDQRYSISYFHPETPYPTNVQCKQNKTFKALDRIAVIGLVPKDFLNQLNKEGCTVIYALDVETWTTTHMNNVKVPITDNPTINSIKEYIS